MKKSDNLKIERKKNLDAQAKLFEARDARDVKEFTDEERAKFKKLDESFKDLDARVRQAEAEEEAEARIAAAAGGSPVGGSEEREEEALLKKYSLYRAIKAGDASNLTGVEKELHEMTSERAMNSGVAIGGIAVPMGNFSKRAEKRADGQTVTQDSGNFGGNLVATELGSVIEQLRPEPVLTSLGARTLTGLQGNLKWPVNEGGVTASWEGEVATGGNTKNQFGSKEMTPNRLYSAVLISLQNLMQSSPDLEAMTYQDIRWAIANAIDVAGINGPGSANQPLGILNATGTNEVVAGDPDGANITWNDIVDLETSVFVENAQAAKMNYLINPSTRGFLKKTKHQAGDANYLMGIGNELNGYNAATSTLVPNNLTKGISVGICSAAIFGDFSQLIIGQWGFLDMTVDNVSRKKDGYVEIILNTFVDVLVRQPKAFSIMKDITLT